LREGEPITPDATPRPIRRKWTMPPGWGGTSPKAQVREQSARLPDASAQAPQRSFGYYVSRFVVYLMFFGLVALFAGSRFPLDLGVFLFFTDDEFIVWVLGRTGIRLVPDTVGTKFVSFFVWLMGLAALLAIWRASAPMWLASWLPPPAAWWVLALVAGVIVAIDSATTALIKKVLPRFGIARDSLRWILIEGPIRLFVLGALVGLLHLL
jgi:hypothetical protein